MTAAPRLSRAPPGVPPLRAARVGHPAARGRHERGGAIEIAPLPLCLLSLALVPAPSPRPAPPRAPVPSSLLGPSIAPAFRSPVAMGLYDQYKEWVRRHNDALTLFETGAWGSKGRLARGEAAPSESRDRALGRSLRDARGRDGASRRARVASAGVTLGRARGSDALEGDVGRAPRLAVPEATRPSRVRALGATRRLGEWRLGKGPEGAPKRARGGRGGARRAGSGMESVREVSERNGLELESRRRVRLVPLRSATGVRSPLAFRRRRDRSLRLLPPWSPPAPGPPSSAPLRPAPRRLRGGGTKVGEGCARGRPGPGSHKRAREGTATTLHFPALYPSRCRFERRVKAVAAFPSADKRAFRWSSFTSLCFFSLSFPLSLSLSFFISLRCLHLISTRFFSVFLFIFFSFRRVVFADVVFAGSLFRV